MTGPEVTAAMKAEDVDAGLVRTARAAVIQAKAIHGPLGSHDEMRIALAAVLPEIQAQTRKAMADDLTWLADAREEYQHADVVKETDAVRVALDIAQGGAAWGWLPSWRWDEWKTRAARLAATTEEQAT